MNDPMTSPWNQNLGAAIIRASTKIPNVAPDKRNAYDKYDYASAEEIIRLCRSALLSEGIRIYRKTDGRYYEKGEKIFLPALFTVHHPESGEIESHSYHWPVTCQRQNQWGKAVAVAWTSCTKYFLVGYLQLSRISPDDDMDFYGKAAEPTSSKRGDDVVAKSPAWKFPFKANDHTGAIDWAIKQKAFDSDRKAVQEAYKKAIAGHKDTEKAASAWTSAVSKNLKEAANDSVPF